VIYSPETLGSLQTVQRYNPDERILQAKAAREQSLRIFKPKKGIKRRKLLTEEVNNLYSSSNIIHEAGSVGIETAAGWMIKESGFDSRQA
jgi:hypothetical protein